MDCLKMWEAVIELIRHSEFKAIFDQAVEGIMKKVFFKNTIDP